VLTTVSLSQIAKNLAVTLDNTLSFSANIKAVTRSCRFMLCNICRVRPYLTKEAAQVLMQALVISRLDYRNSLLAAILACVLTLLRFIQNAAACLVLNLSKFSQVSPLLHTHHWRPVEVHIHYKAWYLPNEQQEELPLPTFRLCSNPIPQPSTTFCHLWSLSPPSSENI
jgi:hypothetical protein